VDGDERSPVLRGFEKFWDQQRLISRVWVACMQCIGDLTCSICLATSDTMVSWGRSVLTTSLTARPTYIYSARSLAFNSSKVRTSSASSSSRLANSGSRLIRVSSSTNISLALDMMSLAAQNE
jgi:hypothetical protein